MTSDIYEDYKNYITESVDLLVKLENTNSKICILFQDVKLVLDYIYNKHHDGAKIDDDMAEIFDIGFGYLSNLITDLDTYYGDYFKQDIILLNQYADLVIYSAYLEDLKSFLISEDYLTPEREEAINNMGMKIDRILMNGDGISDSLKNEIEIVIEESIPKSKEFFPVTVIFQEIAEELELFE